jgi:hypothetical protein
MDLGSVWLESEMEQSDSILVSQNGMTMFYVWKREKNRYVF